MNDEMKMKSVTRVSQDFPSPIPRQELTDFLEVIPQDAAVSVELRFGGEWGRTARVGYRVECVWEREL